MNQAQLDNPIVAEYLRRLDDAAQALPRRERHDLVEDIRSHLAAALAERTDDETAIRNAVERLGEPEDIVASAGGTRRSVGGFEIAAIVGILGGGLLVPIVGWLVGVVLLWASQAWSVGQKLLGTLVVPGGLATPVMLRFLPAPGGYALHPTLGMIVLIVTTVGPIAVAVYLLRIAHAPRESASID